MRNISLLALLLIVAVSCGDYNKIVKSTDYEYKFKKGIEYFEKGEFARSGALFHDLLSIYRVSSRADQVYYYYAKSMMGQSDYLMATQYFRSLLREQPMSKFAEESQFMIGYASYLMSPKPLLDQQTTINAIEAFQLYVNLYPFSDRVDEAHRLIDELRDKLVQKSFLNAKLYYDFENFKAAVVALENAVKEYPDSRYREELLYMLLKSRYFLAVNSVEDKKEVRLSNALDEYFAFVDEFPASKHRREANRFYTDISKLMNYSNRDTNSNE
ncbi:MAG: outer membrane protein assembly factor BamD [Prolixibacteraceae bacterium]|nr:outer membrane protein assembly factor BamD [Prolixibacteraceae bacterium]